MSVPIRKLLSRKFNLFLFEFGRSPDLCLAYYLPAQTGSGLEVVATISLTLRLNLQLREQFWSCTRFPFNRAGKTPTRTKILNESNHYV